MQNPVWAPLSRFHLTKEEHHKRVRDHLDQAIERLGQRPDDVHAIADKVDALDQEIAQAKTRAGLATISLIAFFVLLLILFRYRQLGPLENILSLSGSSALIWWAFAEFKKLHLLQGDKRAAELELGDLHNSIRKFFPRDFFRKVSYASLPGFELFGYLSRHTEDQFRQAYSYFPVVGEQVGCRHVHVGVLNPNPFMARFSTSVTMQEKTYTGSKVIKVKVPTYVNGKRRIVNQNQIISASISKPAPVYQDHNHIFLCSNVARDLSFFRKESGLLSSFQDKYCNVDLINKDFNRVFINYRFDNQQQFRLLFTPLAQEQIAKSIKFINSISHWIGFEKRREIFSIRSDMLGQFRNIISTDIAELSFNNFSEFRRRIVAMSDEAFKFLFLSMSPLLSIPILQRLKDQRAVDALSLRGPPSDSFLEAMAYWIGEKYFKYPDSRTQNIFEATSRLRPDGSLDVLLAAHGFNTINRRSWGYTYANGKRHRVPIDWVEYKPVCKKTRFVVDGWGDEAGGHGAKHQTNGRTDYGFANSVERRGNQLVVNYETVRATIKLKDAEQLAEVEQP